MPSPSVPPPVEKSDRAKARKAYEDKVKTSLEAFIKRLVTTPIKDHQVDAKLDLKELREICLRAREQFMIEPPLVRVKAPVVILGDLHGQFVDFIRMLEKLGTPPKQKLLFLGDYVDRGNYSLETVTLLLAMKVRYPRAIWMLRGNHETRAVNKPVRLLRRMPAPLHRRKGTVDPLPARVQLHAPRSRRRREDVLRTRRHLRRPLQFQAVRPNHAPYRHYRPRAAHGSHLGGSLGQRFGRGQIRFESARSQPAIREEGC
ncbi:hypothetical protein L596_028130 [Steinernema carpocapsae]|uniref:Serine/threonine-protein phosphatase n=1 Tax=Steinernema carpocapsae TaxID=34508 RepID=A0A4U5LXK2_STECR|nr:hypothetical protein L596_028130 [Steinernema carpocapsae]